MQEKTNRMLETIERSLLGKGKKFTAPRREVLKILLRDKTPMKAYDVVSALRGAKPMTVYRALDFLVGEGLVHRIESLNAYVPCAEKHCVHTDSHYMICDSCGRTEELHNHAINDYIRKNISGTGFKPVHTTMEIHGLCAACQ